jgi:hypothetical protein
MMSAAAYTVARHHATHIPAGRSPSSLMRFLRWEAFSNRLPPWVDDEEGAPESEMA